jgi:hypothetical protein
MHLLFLAFRRKAAPASLLVTRGFVVMGLLSALLGLVGCDSQRIAELEEGVATEADVRTKFGEPENIWSAADMAGNPFPGAVAQPGARTFEYNRQPQGQV